MKGILVFILIAVSFMIAPAFAIDSAEKGRGAELKKLRAGYNELFEYLPASANMAAQDFIDGFATYEEINKRLAAMKAVLDEGSCSSSNTR